MRSFILLLTFALVSSCASKKKDLADRFLHLFEGYAKEFSESNISRVAKDRPDLPQNFRMGVYFKDPKELSSEQPWEWTEKDKQQVMSVFTDKGKVGRVFELIDTGAGDDIKSLRLMGAQQGADAVLVVQGLAEVDSNLNPWGITYLALVPVLFVKGNDVESEFLTQAVLWDVREAYVHLGVESEGEWSDRRPLAFRKIPRAVRKSKDESLSALTKKLERQYKQL